MEETSQILKEQIEKIPKILKRFILNNEWKKQLEEYLVAFKLENWQKTIVENEVFIILMGFEDYNNLSKNILEQTGIEEVISNQISDLIIKNILEPIAIEVVKEEKEKVVEKPSNNIGNSFEQIILNQAIAMQPARNPSLDSASTAGGPALASGNQVPENLPTEENKAEEIPKDIHNYESGRDPYREPLE